MAQYTQNIETKVIRHRHLVEIWSGSGVATIHSILSSIPMTAKVTDWSTDDYTGHLTLEFMDEQESKE